MRIVPFVNETKEKVLQSLLEISGGGHCVRETVPLKVGTADVAVIRGGALEKAAMTHLVLNQVMPPGATRPLDYMVFQVEIYPDNPYCPMGHFNTEWALTGSGPYHMNLDLFPAIIVKEDIAAMRAAMDAVAQRFGMDAHKMRTGLDEHYNMAHWDAPLAAMVGCKLLDLKEDQLELFIAAYQTFLDTYLKLLRSRQGMSFTEADKKVKLRRNGKWLEYITLKDPAVKMALATGITPDVLIKLSFPPSAEF
jgi:coproporphyrinogen III oxidase